MNQREMMRRLVSQLGADEDTVCRFYASAEEQGEIARQSTRYPSGSLKHAHALYREGLRKGWLEVPLPVPPLLSFRVQARVTLVDNGSSNISFTLDAADEADVHRQVTPKFMRTISEWGRPVRSVRVIKVQPIRYAALERIK